MTSVSGTTNNNNNNNVSNLSNNNNNNSGIAAKLLNMTQEANCPTDLNFVTTNRVVAAMEKAMERLQLLQLLDPDLGEEEEASQQTVKAASAVERSAQKGPTTLAAFLASQSTAKQNGANASLRAAATYDATSRAKAEEVTTALHDTFTAASGGRGRQTVSQLLVEQAALERQYGELLRQAAPVRPPASEPLLHTEVAQQLTHRKEKTAGPGIEAQLQQVSARLREVNRMLCIQLKDNPNDRDNWLKINNERADLAELLRGAVAELTEGYQSSMVRTAGNLNATTTNGNMKASLSGAGAEALLGTSYSGAAGGGGMLTRTGSARSMLSQLQQPDLGATLSGTTNNNYYDGNSSQPTLRKKFGSTMQLRRGTRNLNLNPKIPLQSSFEKLCRTVLQERAAYLWTEEMILKERELNLNVKQLRSDLLKERQLKEEEVADRQRRLGVLQGQLRDLQKKLSQREEDFTMHGNAVTEGLQRRAAAQDKTVAEQSTKTAQKLEEEGRTHQLFADHLRKRTEAADRLATEWEQKNARDIRQVESQKMEKEQERHVYADRLTQCQQEKEAHLAKQKEREQFTAEREEAVQLAEERRTLEYEAASQLEAAVKAMLVREALLKGAKKKKGGKKKKK